MLRLTHVRGNTQEGCPDRMPEISPKLPALGRALSHYSSLRAPDLRIEWVEEPLFTRRLHADWYQIVHLAQRGPAIVYLPSRGCLMGLTDQADGLRAMYSVAHACAEAMACRNSDIAIIPKMPMEGIMDRCGQGPGQLAAAEKEWLTCLAGVRAYSLGLAMAALLGAQMGYLSRPYMERFWCVPRKTAVMAARIASDQALLSIARQSRAADARKQSEILADEVTPWQAGSNTQWL